MGISLPIRRSVAAAGVLLLATCLVPAIASAHKKVWSTTTTEPQRVQWEAVTVFSGMLTSPKAACTRQRSLNVFEKPWGDESYRPYSPPTITSDAEGAWSLEVENRNTWRYRVQALRKSLPSQGDRHRHVCGGFFSPEMEVLAPG